MNYEIDVIILGDGIAGLSAAILGRSRGLRTWIVSLGYESNADRLLAIHPGAQVIFEELKITSLLNRPDILRPTGTFLRTNTSESFKPYCENEVDSWRGYLLSQRTLLKLLKQRVDELRVKTLTDQRAEILRTPAGKVQGICINGFEVKAKLTIDASGPRNILARSLDHKHLFGSPTLIATTEWESDTEEMQAPIFHSYKHKWTWSASVPRVGHSRVSLSLLPNKKEIAQLKLIKNDVTWKYLPNCAGDGYAVIGDAALRLDPASGNGVIRAFMMSANAIKLVTESNRYNAYKDWVASWAIHDGKELATRYGADPFHVPWATHHQWMEKFPEI